MILFIFAVTSGSSSGWATARVLVPLVVSVFMMAGFFYYETRIPPAVAAVYVGYALRIYMLIALFQTTKYLVLTKLRCSRWRRSPTIFLVDNNLHSIHDALAKHLSLVCYHYNRTYVSTDIHYVPPQRT